MRSFSPLQLALGASIAVHVVLLTVRFVDPEAFNRVFEDTPLEVILVNARTTEKPSKALAIAQASMAGGGETEKGRATSPLPPALRTETGDDVEQYAQHKLQNLQEQQNLLLAQIKNQLAALPPPDPKQPTVSTEQAEREEKRRQLIKLLAEIERRINQENARPKKRYISPATREEVYAVYYDHLRRAVEDKGTENFPQAGGKKLYGELTMIVTVNFDGRVLNIEIVESSGNRTLDRRAEAIARSAAPFGRFNAAMRRQAEQIMVVSRFKFTRDETLETQLTAQ
ncbi:MAG: energy transducer TonB [Rhodoferax sp.]|uniref:energy transducer TonB n=1 Tax=Rhodoferax sp. TaxID=50421 RepID=UPI00179003D5|nr:TonB family protein [Rhodoferax sp.]NMM13660.1 energy transducer TonB [Rhodoferax sp.]NMM20523.1 energy transducer TonB [Rhodoferax sp.]